MHFQQNFPPCESTSHLPPHHIKFPHVSLYLRRTLPLPVCFMLEKICNSHSFFAVFRYAHFSGWTAAHTHTQCSHIYGQWLDVQRSSPKRSYFMHSHSVWPLIYGAHCSSIGRTERMHCINWARNRVRYATMRRNCYSFQKVHAIRVINCCRSKKVHSTLPCKVKVPFNRLSCRATTFWTKSGKSSAAVSSTAIFWVFWASLKMWSGLTVFRISIDFIVAKL